jgi:hypothetical protein
VLIVEIIFIVLFVSVVGIGVMFYLFVVQDKTPQRHTAWEHVRDAIGGAHQGTKICGTHQGYPVEVFLSRVGDEVEIYRYYLRFKVPIQGFDWTIILDSTRFFDPEKPWQIKSDDEALKLRLVEAGAVALVKNVSSNAQVRYRADKGTLEYQILARADSYVPTADEFQMQLNLLTTLAELNTGLNDW